MKYYVCSPSKLARSDIAIETEVVDLDEGVWAWQSDHQSGVYSRIVIPSAYDLRFHVHTLWYTCWASWSGNSQHEVESNGPFRLFCILSLQIYTVPWIISPRTDRFEINRSAHPIHATFCYILWEFLSYRLLLPKMILFQYPSIFDTEWQLLDIQNWNKRWHSLELNYRVISKEIISKRSKTWRRHFHRL
jgi:hypothetical protein